MADGTFLRVRVDNAQKEVTTLESYISYRITTETNIPEICKHRSSGGDDVERRGKLSNRVMAPVDQHENSQDTSSQNGHSSGMQGQTVVTFSVRRRYNDFRWLYDRFSSATLSGTSVVILAPFAERHVLNLDRFAPEFVVRRCALLNSFLQRVANHPKLSRSSDLHALLAESATGFDRYVRANTMSTSFIVSAKLLRAFERASGSEQQSLISTSSQLGDESLVRFFNYGVRFSAIVGQLNTAFQSLHTLQTDTINEYREMASAFTQLSIGEQASRRGLSTLSSACQTHAMLTERQRDDIDRSSFSTLHDYVHFAAPIRTFVHFASAVQSSVAEDIGAPNRNFQNNTSNRGGRATPVDAVKAEMEHWNNEKDRDFATFFSSIAEAHCTALSQSIVSWEAAINALQQQVNATNSTTSSSTGSSNTNRPTVPSPNTTAVSSLSPKSIAAVQRALTNPQGPDR